MSESSAGIETHQLIEQLSLKLLYRFTTHGLVNLVDQSQSVMRSNNVTVDCEGAHFRGSSEQSNLIADTPGFKNLLLNPYSLFVQARFQLNFG